MWSGGKYQCLRGALFTAAGRHLHSHARRRRLLLNLKVGEVMVEVVGERRQWSATSTTGDELSQKLPR